MKSYEQQKDHPNPNQDRVESKVQVTQGTHGTGEKCGGACASTSRHKESVTQPLNDIKSSVPAVSMVLLS